MIDQKEKPKRLPHTNWIPYLLLMGISFGLGVVLASLFIQPRVEYVKSDLIINTTPTGVMIEAFAVRDIACGEKIIPEMVLETSPAQIVIYDNSRTWYPMLPVWQQANLPSLYNSYANQAIPRGSRIVWDYLVTNPVGDTSNGAECLIITPTQKPTQMPLPQPT